METPQGIHVLAKPIGAACNLKCDYCFYLEKGNLYPENKNLKMPYDVLEAYIKSYIRSQQTPEAEFVWHGGEPALRGIDFYKKAVEYQNQYNKSKTIINCFQTNGTLLTDEWCNFFKQNGFLVGISLDGPEDIHDRYRRDRADQPTFKKVMKGLELLKKWEVEFNVMACVAKETAYRPHDVYAFLKEQEIDFVQFTPVVERMPDQKALAYGLNFAMPLRPGTACDNTLLTPLTVEPPKYGDFLIGVFDEWVRNDVGKMFVMNFEWALNSAFGFDSPVCIFSKQCGGALAVEHNGDVYSCDHHVYPEYRVGNIMTEDLADMVQRSLKRGFGPHKEKNLPRCCRECDVLQACRGGCPKDRFMKSRHDEPGLNYLCDGYKKFFRYSAKYMSAFKTLLELELDPACIMQAVGKPLVIPASEKTGNKKVMLWIK